MTNDRIANELLIAREVMHTNNVDRIAEVLRYSPILIINALYEGERSGKLVYHRKQKTIDVGEGVEVKSLALTSEFMDAGSGINISEQIEQLIRNLNSDQTDMSAEELSTWLPGSSDVHVKMLAYVNPNLATYEFADPKDKESVYTFITLEENKLRRWGEKQFDSKRSRVAQRAKDAKNAKKAE